MRLRFANGVGGIVSPAPPIKTRDVRFDPLAKRAADQLVHGLAERATDEIPQRDVDSAQGVDDRASLTVGAHPSVELFPEHLDIEGIAAAQLRQARMLEDRSRNL